MKEAISANVITMVCDLGAKINPRRTFEFLPISVLRSAEDGKPIVFFAKKDGKKVRLQVRYYNYDSIIISCREGNSSRGLRQGGDQLQHVVGIDLQLHGKNYNCKISTEKLQLTGALNAHNGTKVFEFVCKYLMDTQAYLNTIKELGRDIIPRVLNYFYDDEECDLPNDILAYFNMIRDRRDYTHDDMDRTELTRKEFEGVLNRMFDNPCIIEAGIPQPQDIKAPNSFFTHSLGRKDIPLVKLFNHLMKAGFRNVYFNNTMSASVCLTIPRKDVDALHRFVFFSSGTVRQHSPSFYEEAYEMYAAVFEEVDKFLDRLNREDELGDKVDGDDGDDGDDGEECGNNEFEDDRGEGNDDGDPTPSE